ncbi:MAG TPA: iron ABC transporter permease [Pseudonocardiaceae bacterium]|nr:iron ABC transporter permease [Pseudonocardiaceae bacterium]
MTTSEVRGSTHTSPHWIRGGWYLVSLFGLLGGLGFALLLGIGIGSVQVPLPTVAAVIVDHLLGRDPRPGTADQIVWQFRAPRVLLAALAGAGLAVSGTMLQAVVRNPLADPYVLGLSQGAGLGATVVIVLGTGALSGLGVSAAAFLGALASLAAVVILGQRAGQFVPTRLVLAGVAVGYLLSAMTNFFQFHANPEQLRSVVFWLLGSVAGAAWDQLWLPALCVATVTIWAMTQNRRLNALLLGDEAAIAVGVSVHRFRLQILVASALLTGTIVAVAGGIGFVGLIVPHVVRFLVGPDHRRVLPFAALLAAVFLVVVDVLARTIDPPSDLPLSVLTAAVGSPFFLWLLRRPGRIAGAAG